MALPKWVTDNRLILSFLLAHLLLFYTFHDKNVFWYTFTASMLFLISLSIIHEEFDNRQSFFTNFTYGILSGLILFALFWLGSTIIHVFNLPLEREISQLYRYLSPTQLWQYIVLLFIIIPGEEMFWRGFVQKRIQKTSSITLSVLVSAVLYASVQIYSDTLLLPLAAFVSGIFWGYLYIWKKSLRLVIFSHLVFDLFLLVFYPLN